MTESSSRTRARAPAHDDIYDLEDSHRRRSRACGGSRRRTSGTRLRRHGRPPEHPGGAQGALGASIRFDLSKLNLKAAGYGAPVEWHQDWAFYPHTNDDLAAVGIMIDDVDETNGPLMVIPGSHKGPIFDHHDDRASSAARSIRRAARSTSRSAVKLTGPAGSITIHHARTVHGSATNTSGRPRRLLLHQYRAADAWPLLGVPDYQAYRGLLLCGEDRWSRAWRRRRSGCRCRRPRIRARSTRTSARARAASFRPPTSSAGGRRLTRLRDKHQDRYQGRGRVSRPP